jgi:hypothetical protein
MVADNFTTPQISLEKKITSQILEKREDFLSIRKFNKKKEFGQHLIFFCRRMRANRRGKNRAGSEMPKK